MPVRAAGAGVITPRHAREADGRGRHLSIRGNTHVRGGRGGALAGVVTVTGAVRDLGLIADRGPRRPQPTRGTAPATEHPATEHPATEHPAISPPGPLAPPGRSTPPPSP
ncbi:hypothetical protein [Lentzea sp.]|uniref:hypothetical protein n=1 Tax=Lentzea sp. TaxID=56099 RepID=UPI002CF95EB6|nr:hypothetical protein [Lentzea sp.]HUQ54060.1 hypothetical protein [Lentzea sp.]